MNTKIKYLHWHMNFVMLSYVNDYIPCPNYFPKDMFVNILRNVFFLPVLPKQERYLYIF